MNCKSSNLCRKSTRNRLKSQTIKPAMSANIPPAVGRSCRVTRCDNVRVVDGRLVAARRPGLIDVATAGQKVRLLTVGDHSRLGRVALYKIGDNDMLAYSLLDNERPTLIPVGVVRDDVVKLVESTLDEMLMIAPEGIKRLEVDCENRKIALAILPEKWSEWQLLAGDTRIESIEVAGRKISRVYDEGARALSSTDAETMHRDGMAAISRLVASISAAGRFAQAVLARYRLLDKRGVTLFVSSPLLLSSSAGLSLTGRGYATLNADRSGYSAWSVGGASFSVNLVKPITTTAPERLSVAEIVVEMSPLLFPFATDSNLTGQIISRPGREEILQAVFEPGGSSVTGDNHDNAGEALVERLLGVGDPVFSPVLRISDPFSRQESTFKVKPPLSACSSVQNQISRLKTLAASKTCGSDKATVGLPHTLGAASAARVGRALALGNLSVKLFEGHSMKYMSAGESKSTQWRGQISVVFDDGSRVVSVAEFEGGNVPAVNGLFYYPAGNAVRVEIQCDGQGGRYGVSLPLRKIGAGGGACYVNRGALPIELSPVASFQHIDPEQSICQYPKGVVLVEATDPSAVLAASLVEASGTVVAMLEVDRRASSWESNRRRLYVATAGGLDGVSISDCYEAMRWERIDKRGARRPDCLLATPGGRYSAMALLDGDVIGLKSGSAKMIMSSSSGSFDAIGWDCNRFDLWVSDEGRSLAKVIPEGGDSHFTITRFECERIFPTSSGPVFAGKNGVISDFAHEAEPTVDAAWEADFRAPCDSTTFASCRVTGVTAGLFGRRPMPQLRLLAGYEPKQPGGRDVTRYVITEIGYQQGATLPTVINGLITPAFPYLTFAIEGQAADEMFFTEARIFWV